MSRMGPAIWWIRRDLRLSDNPALQAALASGQGVLPLFVLDPGLLSAPNASAARAGFMLGGLKALDDRLRQRGSHLIVRLGSPTEVLPDVVQETGASAVFAEADVTPYARRRDSAVQAAAPLQLVGWPTVHSPGEIVKANGDPYTVFTPFQRAWRQRPLPAISDLIPSPQKIETPEAVESLPVPDLGFQTPSAMFAPGEDEAHRRLARFTAGTDAPVYRYAEGRDQVADEGTSQLSPYLRFGMLSARQAIVAALLAGDRAPDRSARESANIWLSELIWREFFAAILVHHPHILRHSFRPVLRKIHWANDRAEFDAWCQGQTGYPLVDAAMRQLLATGWMHNRARMVAASFLVKDLLVDWRWGERWFMQHLLDGDPASNNGGWQWTAGTGTDAAPYFRVFNPTAQAERFDPDGAYIRRWVPELRQVPTSHIHAPWKMPSEVQAQAGCIIGSDYPARLVDHAWARERTLAAYAAARRQSAIMQRRR